MRTIAVFDYYLGGHHIEYIHHLYVGACKRKNCSFLFILPTSFNLFSKKLIWEKTDNVEFVFFECEEKVIRSYGKLKRSFMLSKIVSKFVCSYKIKELVLIETMPYLPFLPFLISRKVKISSIIYNIARFRESTSLITRLSDSLLYIIISFFSCFNRVYLLNDFEGGDFYNKKYSVNKFLYLPDPYMKVGYIENFDVRTEYKISKDKKILLHFGGLSERKGTIDILDSIMNLPHEISQKYCFIFAGRVYDDIKETFYRKINLIGNRCQIIVFDKFCEYDFLGTLCKASDLILIPYHKTSQSSGVISYAAQYLKPVIGPSNGLIGNIIIRYKLGIGLNIINANSIANCLSNNQVFSYKIDVDLKKEYLNKNTVEKFVDCIYHNA